MEEEPKLPRPFEDPARLQELREAARKRLDGEGSKAPYGVQVFGGAPVYGGPPSPRRRWAVWGLFMAIAASLLGFLAWLFGKGHPAIPATIYGGPPVNIPTPPQERAPTQPPEVRPSQPPPPVPVYGGPVPAQSPPEPPPEPGK